VSNEIVHIVDMFPTLAHVGGADVPKDRPIAVWINRIFSLESRRTLIEMGFLLMSLIGYRQ
jgi:hypothetical protein